MTDINLEDIKHVHCIGIGGIGVSAIARYMIHEGKTVSSSDIGKSTITEGVEELGIKVNFGHSKENIPPETNLVVYTTALPEDNPELVFARENNLLTLTYAETLGLISKDKRTVAIAGTHGKTTTTAMIGKILLDCGLHPTVIVGSLLKEYKSNFVPGTKDKGDDIFVVEACEYKKALLQIKPNIAVVTNIDEDHMDVYKDLNEIKETFEKFTSHMTMKDHLVCHCEQPNLSTLCSMKTTNIHNVDENKIDIEVSIPGEHNKENARLAYEVAKILGCDDEKIRKSLKNFSGTWRRFEYKGLTKNKAIVYDDYAHHPEAIRATLDAAHEAFPDKKIFVLFQPHLFSRTKTFLKEFVRFLANADEVGILPIYAAREMKDPSISSEHIVGLLKENGVNAHMFDTFNEASRYAVDNTNENNVIFTIGAGNINEIGDSIIEQVQ